MKGSQENGGVVIASFKYMSVMSFKSILENNTGYTSLRNESFTLNVV